MSINTIAAASSLNYWNQEAQTRTDHNVHSAAGAFGQILARLTATQAASDAETEDGVSTVTLTKLLSDGSLVILKVAGNRVISEAKLDGTSVLEQQQLMGQGTSLPSQTGAAMMGSVEADSGFSATV